MMRKRTRSPGSSARRAGVATAAALPVVALAVGAASPAFGASNGRSTINGTQPSWATSSHQEATPFTAHAKSMTFQVVLTPRHAKQAAALAEAVNDPNSPQYQHYLSAKQYTNRFGPSKASVKKVKKFLKSAGFTVTGVPANRRWVTATGSQAEVDKAFDTSIQTYRYKGKNLRAPARAVSVPSSVASDVQTVTGLDDSGLLRHPFHHRRAGSASANAKKQDEDQQQGKCSNYWAQHSQTVPPAYGDRTQYPTYICGYVPDQMESAYGVKSAIAQGRDGSGVTVAIIDAYASPTILKDVNTYSQRHGLPTIKPPQGRQKKFTPFNMQDACGGEANWNSEETLDVEAVHSMAPGANIYYLGAQNCDQGIDEALNYAVQHQVADMVSNSYGNQGEDIPASEIAKEHMIFEQAAAEGMGMYFSSGDSGDEAATTGFQQPDYPASDPMVTAVGGTSLAIGASNNRQFATGWGTDLDPVDPSTDTGYAEPLPGSFRYGAGGGVSQIFDQPDYQKGVVPPNLSHRYGGQAKRVVPDVAAVGDPYTGFLMGETTDGTYSESAIGGTSLACPTFVGIQALASQGRSEPIGFANPELYANHGTKAFNDVVPTRTPKGVTNPSGSYLVTLGRDSSLRTAYGYDDVTGVGAPNGSAFLTAEDSSSSGGGPGDGPGSPGGPPGPPGPPGGPEIGHGPSGGLHH